MKYHKFLMALALYMGISANTSYCAAGAYDALSRSGAAAWNFGPKRVWDYGVKGLKHGAGLLSKRLSIPSSVFNAMAGWSVNKIIMIVGAGIVTLVAWYGKEDIMKWLTGVVSSTKDQRQIKFSYEILLKKTDEPWIDFFHRLQNSPNNTVPYEYSINDDEEALEKSKSIMVNILKKNLLTLTEIGNLQRAYSSYPVGLNLFNSALQDVYKDKYRLLLDKLSFDRKENFIESTMADVANDSSQSKNIYLTPEDLQKEKEIPEKYNGLNWGKDSPRYLALEDLLKEVNAVKKD